MNENRDIVFVDVEVGVKDRKIHDIGALRTDGAEFHAQDPRGFVQFIKDASILCGHNIVHHDIEFLQPLFGDRTFRLIDTLYWSPLLFPERPYHRLLKDDKILSDELNNPLSDAKKAKTLYEDEIAAFTELTPSMREIYFGLLGGIKEFKDFLWMRRQEPRQFESVEAAIRSVFAGRICQNANLRAIIRKYPVELAYALAIIRIDDAYSIIPPWVVRQFPKVENAVNYLCATPCAEGCTYCKERLDAKKWLKRLFGFDSFRTYAGEPLQEDATKAAVEGKSLIAVFPTGGGKSITFQLPALMAGRNVHGLTVVISPLQSLMKDQVDNLYEKGITDAVTVNGLLNPIERAEAFKRAADGSASLIYISPEQLRSKTVEEVLAKRNIVRFVIDEAHCFSAWGHDFRVDYLYIGVFIKRLQERKLMERPIPVSCFTATAKQKVISGIRDYFIRKLDLKLDVFVSSATRENLHYFVLHRETDAEKYATTRMLIEQKMCPTIVYVSRTRKTHELSQRLTDDGFPALPFNGKMDSQEKIANQEAFINDEVRVIVATSAFGMGVDKKDVGLVIHYDISDSLENYVQEAGRAGRDPGLNADCYILYCDEDLNKHFLMLNRTKLSQSDIQMVWRAIKQMSPTSRPFCTSAFELARKAGWDDSVMDVETRVKTAVSALEETGYVKRERNAPRVYATGILANTMAEASECIRRSPHMNDEQRTNASRIIKSLISARSRRVAGDEGAESRVDYLADMLGLEKSEVIEAINLMRDGGILADTQDMTARFEPKDTERKALGTLTQMLEIESLILSHIADGVADLNLKEINEGLSNCANCVNAVTRMRTIIRFLAIRGLVKAAEYPNTNCVRIASTMSIDKIKRRTKRCAELAKFALRTLFHDSSVSHDDGNADAIDHHSGRAVPFSLVGLTNQFNADPLPFFREEKASLDEMSEALLFLTRIGAMRLEGGILVIYNAMRLTRIVKDNKRLYRKEDYNILDQYYKSKTQQIHIVGQFANLMIKTYDIAMGFVHDYFAMEYEEFKRKYFDEEIRKQLDQSITISKRKQLFEGLSDLQSEILSDNTSRIIAVAAGPGSGKTLVLVRKLAALLMLEEVKPERLLMLTFSRAAAIVFKTRLTELIGGAARFVEIKTFHSYCFDLVGKVGNLENSDAIINTATSMIENGDVEPSRIAKSVIVIDEAQDMDADNFRLLSALFNANDGLKGTIRIIAVGDDDQNIYGFRGSDSKHFKTLSESEGAKLYEMTENFRSAPAILTFANAFAHTIGNRMKTLPLFAQQGAKEGTVRLIHHTNSGFESLVAQECADECLSGKTCILTFTNDQALLVFSHLTAIGIPAQLIQSNETFRLADLAEIRYFTKYLTADANTPVISDKKWAEAKTKLRKKYERSSCLEHCLRLIDTFETATDHNHRYTSDFEEFLRESHYEDFFPNDSPNVVVSTIHKSKGREYDSVYMLLDNVGQLDDEKRRSIYVGITRAKTALCIHYAEPHLFHGIVSEGTEWFTNDCKPVPASKVLLQLSLHDVVLDFFKDKKHTIVRLESGHSLVAVGNFLEADVNGTMMRVVKFSRNITPVLNDLKAKGYEFESAIIRFIVAWKGENDQEECAVILPDMYFRKKS